MKRIVVVNRFVLNPVSYHGAGAIAEIPGELALHGKTKVFLCADAGLVQWGVAAKVIGVLDGAGVAWELFSDVKPNPTVENVQDGVAAFKASGADAIVAVGGRSAMDAAKAIGIIIANPEFEDAVSLEGVAPTKNHTVFTIAVPTTAGTVAEVTINYVITDIAKKRKFVCVDVNDIPEVAVVDPIMMSGMPPALTASTGMDVLTHAIEGYLTKGAWALSDMCHLEVIKIISHNLRDAVAEAESGEPGGGRTAFGPCSVHRRYGLLQRGPRHRPLYGSYAFFAVRSELSECSIFLSHNIQRTTKKRFQARITSGRPTTERRSMAIAEGGRLRFQGLCSISLSVLFLAGLALRFASEFYGLPGFSIKGIDHPDPFDMLMIVGAIYIFMAGTWGRFRPAVGLSMRVCGLVLMFAYDISTLWQWGSHAMNPWFSDAAEYLSNYTMTPFWVAQKIAASALVLSLLRFFMDRHSGLRKVPHGTGRPTPI